MAKAIDNTKQPTAKLTGKRRKLIKGIAEGKTQRQAAKDAGLNECHASVILKEPQVKATLLELMERMGLDDGSLLVKHRELLNAQKQISGVRDADGGSVEFIEVPDHQVQVKAMELAYKLKGAFVEKKEITFPEGIAINVNFKGTNGDDKR